MAEARDISSERLTQRPRASRAIGSRPKHAAGQDRLSALYLADDASLAFDPADFSSSPQSYFRGLLLSAQKAPCRVRRRDARWHTGLRGGSIERAGDESAQHVALRAFLSRCHHAKIRAVEPASGFREPHQAQLVRLKSRIRLLLNSAPPARFATCDHDQRASQYRIPARAH